MKRMRPTRAVVILCAALLATACYESSFPIESRPKNDIDPGLPGIWRCLPFNQDPSENATTLTIAPSATKVYAVTLEEDGGQPSRYEAYASSAAEGLMNVRELADGDKKPWMFVRGTLLQPSVLQLQVLDGKGMTEHKIPDELRRAVERVRGKAGAFTDVCVCVRSRPENADQ